MKRREGWEERFNSFIIPRLTAQFEWGTHDCLLFAADSVRALTLVDPGAEYRGTYDSALAAAKVVSDAGGALNLISAKLGTPEDNPWLALKGDIGLVKAGEPFGHMAVVCADKGWYAVSEAGVVLLPTTDVVAVWRL